MQEFIEAKKTIKNVDRDFIEWHKGKEYYVLWAVEINDAAWLKSVENARSRLDDFLWGKYVRKPHITICTSGFLEKSKTYDDKLKRQIELLENSSLYPFMISLGGLNSFTTCPYLEIEDSTDSFARIRAILLGTIMEERTKKYVPHITVGLYDDVYSTSLIADKINTFEKNSTEPFRIDKLSYFIYKTDSVFSPLDELFHIKLKGNSK